MKKRTYQVSFLFTVTDPDVLAETPAQQVKWLKADVVDMMTYGKASKIVVTEAKG